jgi:hypothetical protein
MVCTFVPHPQCHSSTESLSSKLTSPSSDARQLVTQDAKFRILVSFYVIHTGGQSAINSANRKSANLRTLKFVRFTDLPQMWHFANLRFANPIFFLFAELWIYDLRTQAFLWPEIFRKSVDTHTVFLMYSIHCSYSNL